MNCFFMFRANASKETQVFVEVVSKDHYRKSALVEGGIEIPYKITMTTPLSLNRRVLKHCINVTLLNFIRSQKMEEMSGTFCTDLILQMTNFFIFRAD